MEKFGVQLVFRPTPEQCQNTDMSEVECYYEDLCHLDDLDWGLSDYYFFGHDTFPADWYVDAVGFTEFYESYLKSDIESIIINTIEEYSQRKDYDKIWDKKIEIPIIVSACWEKDIDWESGIDEGSYEFQFEEILDL